MLPVQVLLRTGGRDAAEPPGDDRATAHECGAQGSEDKQTPFLGQDGARLAYGSSYTHLNVLEHDRTHQPAVK